MKYLKRFNEELDPSTYMSAGKGLLSKGHTTRGQKLIDYSISKTQNSDEFDFYFNGNKMAAKWDYKNNCFITDVIPKKLYVMKRSDSIGVVYANLPLMGWETWPNVYVKTREEAIKLLKFIKSVDPQIASRIKINDLYKEGVGMNPIPDLDKEVKKEEKPKGRFRKWWDSLPNDTSDNMASEGD
jgi:hypothetical protein